MTPSLRFKIILLTLIRTLVNTMHRMVYPLLPTFARGLGVSVDTFTLALTARAVLGAASPLIGAISDQRGRKFGMLVGMFLFLGGTGLIVIWPTFPVFVVGLLLCTIGKYVLDPSIHAYAGDQIPYQQRGQAIAVIEFGWSLSFIVGIPLVGLLISRAGWVAPFPLLTGLAVVSILLIHRQIPSNTHHLAHTIDGKNASRNHLYDGLRDILIHPSAVAGLLFGFFMSAANESVNVVFGVWLEQSFQVQLATLGAASLVIGFSELGGESLVGFITDRVGKRRAITGGLILNSLMAVVLPILGSTLPGAMVGLFVFYLTFEFTIVSGIPMMTEILPARRATLLAVNIAGFSLGRALASWLATPLFAWGIYASALASIGFNLLALLALRRVKLAEPVRQPIEVTS